MNDKQRQAVNRLKDMDSVTVSAQLIAPVLGVSPSVLRNHVLDGDYLLSKVDICGDEKKRIRFFRRDFLQQIGEIPPDPPEKTDRDRLDELIELLRVQNAMLIEIGAHIKKTASAATLTD